ncbi:hypothetical protein G8A07_22395 [Roseateles sp. DAIF2]|uniref:FUSC family protein n=1 Tax=Roseateles sp. DAIF2 TaxID=2714952 RepID=UPI0018A29F8B|nr:FUSC family membrane protein [Roseateles sp. DAIF2]QPF75398.1 hypothetical protein G8A07_22395 [Roseateles sp. DAIF2]
MLLPRLPAHVLNGITVALGIGLLQLLFTGLAGAPAAQLAVSGAIFASLADLPTTASRSWGRVLAAGLLGTLAALVIAALRPWPAAVGLAIALLSFGSMLCLAWGPRAGPMSFAALLSIVFTMAHPPAPDPLAAALHLAGWHLAGALAYLAWSQGVLALLQRHYRSLALAAALRATARLLGSRAALLDQAPSPAEAQELPTWLRDEAQLAERLQAARDLLFAAPDTPRARRETAMLLRAIDLRDILLASRLDLELLGGDALARRVRAAVAARLLAMAAELERAADRLQGAGLRAAPPPSFADVQLAALRAEPDDPRARLLPALIDRLRHLDEDVGQIRSLLDGADAALPLTPQELRLFVAPEGWPLAALRGHLSLASPVLRHALRFGLALGTAYAIALALPWASHPQWLVLSVAVVLRGNLEQTLARRNERVGGTLLGCLLVLGLAQLPGESWLSLVFLVAVGIAHGFVVERYLLTAIAATVMALLQQHLVHPAAGFPVAERLADTLLGALLAWAFSYVLPSWERRLLPAAIARARQALRAYAHQALASEGAAPQRLARRQAYDALGALGAALQRGAAEPARVRLPLREIAALLDHGQRLMAHLSMVRLMLARRGAELQDPAVHRALRAADAELQTALKGEEAMEPPPPAEAPALLPERPPAQDLKPWLLRRLRVSVHDGHQVARAAGQATRALAALQAQR